jgi:hypothetical protein
MGPIRKSRATLRISGDDLVPDEITRILGSPPTRARPKGGVWVSAKTDREFTAKAHTGQWHLEASDREPGDLDSQVQELLGKLAQDIEVWPTLARRFKMDLFCGIFLKSQNEGATLSSDTLAALGNRGIELSLDVYDGSYRRRIAGSEGSASPASGKGLRKAS